MSESKYALGKWRMGKFGHCVIYDKEDIHIATVNSKAIAHRIIACVNACEGIETEVLERKLSNERFYV